MQYEVTLVGRIVVTPEIDGEDADHDTIVEKVFSDTMNELTKLDGIADPQVVGTVASGDVEVSVLVDASEYGEAVTMADATIRAAFHAAEVHTDQWENLPVNLRVMCIRVETDDDVIGVDTDSGDMVGA